MGLRVDHQTTLVVVPATTHGAHTSTHEHDDKAQCTVYGARMSTRQDSKRVADPRDTGAGVHDFKKDSHRERKRERERKSERKRERERERERGTGTVGRAVSAYKAFASMLARGPRTRTPWRGRTAAPGPRTY